MVVVSARDSHAAFVRGGCDGEQVRVDDVVDVEENVELESSR